MKKILFLCLLAFSMIVSAQITLGEGSTYIGSVPVNLFNNYSYSQQIYTKQEINAATAGNITGLKFYMKSSGDLNGATDWVVYLGHTSKTSFANVNEVIPVGQLTKVYSGTVDNINGVVEMTFDVPFSYNNTDNLVVSVHENNPANGYNTDAFYVYEPEPDQGRSILFRGKNSIDISNPSMVLGIIYYYKPVITLIGLTPHPIPACPSVIYPTDNENLVSLTPQINWYSSQGATSYKVSIGTTPGGTEVVNQQMVSTTSFNQSTPLSTNTTYYLKVTSVGTGGESLGCSVIQFRTIPSPSSNDECANAITVIVNADTSCEKVTAGTTLGATNSGLNACDGVGARADDVWYKFTATSSSHTIQLNDIASVGTASSTDMQFQVLSGSCGSMSGIFCSTQTAEIVDGLTVGSTYYVRVYSSYGGTDTAQSFNICVGTMPPPPSNDECVGAINLAVNSDMSCGTVTEGTTLSATHSNIPSPCFNTPDGDVWYKFTATASQHAITLKDIVSVGLFSSTQMAFQVLTGSCNSLTNVQCSATGSAVIDNLIPGATYYVRVYSYKEGMKYAQRFKICIGTPLPPPVNDACTGALIATVPYSYTQLDAAAATNNNGFINVCSDGMNDGTWFKFTGDGSVHEITVSMPAGSIFDAKIGVYKGTCDNLTCVNTVDNNGAGEKETISIATTPGIEYYVNVGYFSANEDNPEDVFTIVINKGNLGVSEISKGENSLKAYPNPFTELLNIANADKIKSISVSEVSGRLIKTIENPSAQLRLRDLKQGVYLLILNMKDGSKKTLKVIKK